MNRVDRLYDLLPVIYRQRDIEQGSPLQMLLRVIAEQVNLVEDDIGQLYENWFIETCADWVVPYIADLIGYRPVRSAGEEADRPLDLLGKILTPRREVANTISYRKRKGTLALLDELSLAIAGWPARAVEFNRFLCVSQNLHHLRESRGRVLDLRGVGNLDLLDSPFDILSHNIDVRSPDSPNSPGKYNLSSVGLFVWRLRVYSATRTPAECYQAAGDHCYTFSILGNDVPLYTRCAHGGLKRAISGELVLPTPIRRRAFAERCKEGWCASGKYYGTDKSIAIWVSKWADLAPGALIPRERIIPADLSDWHYRPKPDHVAVDPELGRIAFHPEQRPRGDVWTSYHYAFSSEIGGGEYSRPLVVPAGPSSIYYVGAGQDFSKIGEAYHKWREEKPAPAHAIIEIADSGLYEEELHLEIGRNQTLELRAAEGARPIIRVSDRSATRPEAIKVFGASGSSLILDGILKTGRKIEVEGPLHDLVLRHCTLVPGLALHPDCKPRHPNEPSLTLVRTHARVRIEHSILGPIQVAGNTEAADPSPVEISDSILDATSFDAPVLTARDGEPAWVALTIQRSTILGEVHVHEVKLAENSLFMGRIQATRRQFGCVRFCYVPPRSRTPKRYHCQPDLVARAVHEQGRLDHLPHEELEALVRAEHFRVEPAFLSTRYGTPNYCRLSDGCAPEIKRGADDRSELGVFHDLYQPQRESNLRTRLEEFTPAGVDAGIIFAN